MIYFSNGFREGKRWGDNFGKFPHPNVQTSILFEIVVDFHFPREEGVQYLINKPFELSEDIILIGTKTEK